MRCTAPLHGLEPIMRGGLMTASPAPQPAVYGTAAATHLSLHVEELEDAAETCALRSIAPMARRNLAARLFALADSLL